MIIPILLSIEWQLIKTVNNQFNYSHPGHFTSPPSRCCICSESAISIHLPRERERWDRNEEWINWSTDVVVHSRFNSHHTKHVIDHDTFMLAAQLNCYGWTILRRVCMSIIRSDRGRNEMKESKQRYAVIFSSHSMLIANYLNAISYRRMGIQ